MTLTWWRLKLKVPLTPNFFLSRQKSPFCSDHIAEKIIVVKFFLDFIWIFKIRKIRTTGVHDRVTRRVDRVGLWRQPGKSFRLERNLRSYPPSLYGAMMREWTDCRSEVTEGLLRGKNTTVPYRCVAANCRNVMDLSKCIFVHNIPSTISWITTGLVGTD